MKKLLEIMVLGLCGTVLVLKKQSVNKPIRLIKDNVN